MSPNADCPASKPVRLGMTEPSTCPQMPRTQNGGFGATRMSQVLVPMILTRTPGRIPAPTAPAWQSKRPTATTTFSETPSFAAHFLERVPTGVSAVKVSV